MQSGRSKQPGLGTPARIRGLLRRAQAGTMSVALLALVACAEAPVKAPPPAPAVISLQEYMQQASKAATDGSPDKARDAYRSAAKDYPASKEPWAKLSGDYFAAGDYGNAILAAQEVLLRDANDTVATSVLAVSGLRISASALQTLRAQNRIAGDTRSEAETMTRTLRTVLGEDVLVPRAPPPNAAPRPRPRPSPNTTSRPAAAASAPAPASGNPFDKLR